MKGGITQKATQPRPPHWNSSPKNITGRITTPNPGISRAVATEISRVGRNELRPPTTSGLVDTASPIRER